MVWPLPTSLTLLLVMMLLASVTLFNVSKLSHRWYVPMALVWTVAFILFGQMVGLTKAQAFLTNWPHGLVWGGACILVITVCLAAGISIPRLHPLFADERVTRKSGPQIAAKVLVEVPLGTVVLEEIVFRSVLLGLLIKLYGTVDGVLWSSALFGLWHVLPALEMHRAHGLTNGRANGDGNGDGKAKVNGNGFRGKVLTVLGTVAGTGAAGLVFAALAVGSGSILAPMGLHWATNGPGSIAAWLVGRRMARRAQEQDGAAVEQAGVPGAGKGGVTGAEDRDGPASADSTEDEQAGQPPG